MTRPETQRVVVPSAQAAQRQFWRHVANRLALAILADARHPVLTSRSGSADSTRPPLGPPRPPLGSDTFTCQVESIDILTTATAVTVTTHPLRLAVQVPPELLNPAQRLTLADLRAWPALKTTEPLFRYSADRQEFRRREGLSGDVLALFEALLRPHAAELLGALDGLRRR